MGSVLMFVDIIAWAWLALVALVVFLLVPLCFALAVHYRRDPKAKALRDLGEMAKGRVPRDLAHVGGEILGKALVRGFIPAAWLVARALT